MPPPARLVRELIVFDFEEYPEALCRQPGPLHVHPFWQMDLYLDRLSVLLLGTGRLTFDQPGHLALIPPLRWHNYEITPGHRRVTFKFTLASHFRPWPRGEVLVAPVPLSLLNYIRSLEALSPRDGLRELEAPAVAELCLAQVLRSAPAPASHPAPEAAFERQLEGLLAEIEARPWAPWRVADLARRCRLSPDHFTRCFTRLLEQSPQRFLLEVRLQAAATALLAGEGEPIKQVAERAGYASVHSFTRAFSRLFGVSPAVFRRFQRHL
jgi:AraC-like DNA-binding protein